MKVAVARLQHARAGLGSLVLRVASLGLTTAVSVVLANSLGAKGFGVYSYVIACFSFLGLPIQMGLPALVLRETARGEATQDWARIRGMWSWATRRILFASSVICALVATAVSLQLIKLGPGTRHTILVGLPLLPILALSQARASALRGLHFPVLGQIPESIVYPGTLLLLGLVAIALHVPFEPVTAMCITLICAACSFSAGAVLLWRRRPAPLRVAPKGHISPDWKRSIWPLAFLAGMQVLSQNLTLILLGFWVPATDIAFYKIAQSAAVLATLGLTVVNLLVVPQFARFHAQKDFDGLQKLAANVAGVSLIVTIPVMIGFLIAGRPLLAVLYGNSFVSSFPVLIILLAGQMVNAFFGSVVSLLNMTGHERDSLVGMAVGIVSLFLFAITLIPNFGIIGAALSAAISMAVWNLLLWLKARQRLGVDSSIIPLLRGKLKLRRSRSL